MRSFNTEIRCVLFIAIEAKWEELATHQCTLVIYRERNHGDELWPKLLS